MEALLGLLLILGVMNESATPVWSELPQECKEIEYEEVVDGLTATKNGVKFILENTQRKHHICVEEPEVVRLPSYIELLNLPAADEMPVVAVFNKAFLEPLKTILDAIGWNVEKTVNLELFFG